MTPPAREADRLLQRIRTLVRESSRDNGANRIDLEGRLQEIERLKARLAELVKQTAGTGRGRP
jgi:hypothetical protein